MTPVSFEFRWWGGSFSAEVYKWFDSDLSRSVLGCSVVLFFGLGVPRHAGDLCVVMCCWLHFAMLNWDAIKVEVKRRVFDGR
jgi:hypothetical protein